MDNLNYDDVCKHIGHLYLNSQLQIQRKEKEALDLLQYSKSLEDEVKELRRQLALKEQANDTGTQGTSGK